MPAVGLLVRDIRTAAGLSRKALATRAGVPTSTISRIEMGEMDPTVGMLERVVGAAGERLLLEAGELPRHAIAQLVDAWRPEVNGERVDWTRVRAITDLLDRKPELIRDAIDAPPLRSGSARIDNLLAGIAEELADRASIDVPTWTRHVTPLSQPWESSGTPAMRQRQARSAPRRLRARGIHLAAATIWRRP